MKKLFSLVLALVLVCSVLPMSAFAAFDPAQYETIMNIEGNWYGYTTGDDGWTDINQEMNVYLQQLEKKTDHKAPVHTYPFEHDLGWNCNTKYHWKECACGARFEEELHVDPKDAENDYCKCGYHFSSNADLVTLWVNGCPGIKNFNKDTTEYTLNAYTYKDVKSIKISTRTHDSEATVELPEDLTLKEGENRFEVKVTAENQKVTKIYTLIINKEPQK